jgi:hypothetical protein
VEPATIVVVSLPVAVGIVPPPVGVPFLAFNAKLEIDLDRKPKEDRFELQCNFTLSSTARRRAGHVTLPPGSFKKHEDGFFTFHGVIDGVRLEALIKRTGTLRHAFNAVAKGAGAGEPHHRRRQRQSRRRPANRSHRSPHRRARRHIGL